MALAWALLSGLVLPSSLIASSVSEFSDIGSYGNPAVFLWYSCFQSLGLFVFWPLCIFFLFKERIQTLLTIVFSMGFVCSVVNAFLFVVNYGSMNITLTFSEDLGIPKTSYILLNFGIMMAICMVVVILLIKNREKIISAIAIVALTTFTILGVLNLGAINRDYTEYQILQKRNEVVINGFEPLFNFSKTGKNILVIMLDMASGAYLEHFFENQAAFNEIFTGFTYYKNTLAFHKSTLMATPSLYGGYEYVPNEINLRPNDLLRDKHNEALLIMPRVLTEQSDFSAIISDSSWANYSLIADMDFAAGYSEIRGISLRGQYSSYVEEELGLNDSWQEILVGAIRRNLLWVSIFREISPVFRPAIYYRGTYFNPVAVVNPQTFVDWFSALHVLPRLTSFDSQENAFMMITNEMTHERIGEIPLENSNILNFPDMEYYKENAVALETIGSWFELLKKNKVYDNTRIIIIADHGIGLSDIPNNDFDNSKLGKYNKEHLYPLFLYKDFNSSGTIQTDMTFMTTADVPTLVLDGIVENPINPFTGKALDASQKEEGVFISISELSMPYHSKSEYIFTVPDDSWYHVKDNIFIDSNWTQEVPR